MRLRTSNISSEVRTIFQSNGTVPPCASLVLLYAVIDAIADSTVRGRVSYGGTDANVCFAPSFGVNEPPLAPAGITVLLSEWPVGPICSVDMPQLYTCGLDKSSGNMRAVNNIAHSHTHTGGHEKV